MAPFLFTPLLLCALVTFHGACAAQCVSYKVQGLDLPAESGLKCGHVCAGEHGLGMLPLLWAPLRVQINCSSSSYTVLKAHSSKALVSRENAVPLRWCGWHHILADPRVCHVSLSPLHDQFLAVAPGDSGGGLFTPGSSGFTCEVDSSRDVSTLHIVLTVLGVLLFFNAPRLSMSTAFRLSSGTLMFVSGAIVVLAFIMMRNVPYRRAVFAFFTVSTSSLLAAIRWVYGTWLPDWQNVVFSRPFLVYVVVTGLLGLAVTYWLDDCSSVKLNTTIRVTLQLSGLLMVYSGLADERVALAAVLAVVFHRPLLALGRGLWRACWWLCGRGAWLLRGVRRAAAVVHHWAWRSSAAMQDADYEEDDQEPLLSDEDEGPGSSRHHQQRKPLRQRAQHAAGNGLDTHPFDTWVGSRQQQQQQGRSPLHLKTPPPLSPFLVDSQWMMDEREERELSVVPQQLRSRDAAAHDAAGYRFPTSAHPQEQQQQHRQQQAASPWSSEKVAVDLSRRRPPSASPAPASPAPAAAAAAAAAGGAGYGPPAAAEGSQVSPLVARGKIINPESGRAIQLDGSRYLALLQQGFTPDFINGVLLPPAAAIGSSGSGGMGTTPNTRRRPSSRQGY